MDKEQDKEMMEVVVKPMVFIALTMCAFVALVDYSFQLIQAINILTQ
jgi:hypothetical protein